MEAVGRSLTDAVRKMLRMPNVDERAIKELVKDLKRTLLQADVNVELVLHLSKAVEERSIKEKLPPGINRREHVVKVLYDFFFQAEDGIRDVAVTGVQTCALPI